MREKQKKQYGMNPTSFRRNRKKVLIKRYGAVCRGCYNKFEPINLTVDHKIPASKGGSSELDNCQLLCRDCNRAKGDQMPGTYNPFKEAFNKLDI